MIIFYFILFIVKQSNQNRDYVDTISPAEIKIATLVAHGLCENCTCTYNKEATEYSTEFCLPNNNCTVLDCCTCKYKCESSSWSRYKKCRRRTIQTIDNRHNSNIFSFINFLLLMFLGLLIVFLIKRVYYYGPPKSAHREDLKEIPDTGLDSNQSGDNSRSSTMLSCSVNRDNSISHVELNELKSLFQTYSLNNVLISPSYDSEQTTTTISDSSTCSVALNSDLNNAKSDTSPLTTTSKIDDIIT